MSDEERKDMPCSCNCGCTNTVNVPGYVPAGTKVVCEECKAEGHDGPAPIAPC